MYCGILTMVICMKKILISDFDKTLYIDRESFLKNINAINRFRAMGNLFVLATGRSINDLNIVLNGDDLPYDYLILNHGTLIMDKKGTIINERYIETDIVKGIYDIAKDYSPWICDQKIYSAVKKDIEFGSAPIHKAMFDFKIIYHDKMKEFYELVKKKYGDSIFDYILQWEDCDEIEFLPSGVNKTAQIDFIIYKENISLENVYTIGDGINDKEMLIKFNGACMEESALEILDLHLNKYKSVANFILDIENK